MTTCSVSPAWQYPSWSMLNEAKCYSQTPVQYASARHTNTRNMRNCCAVTISLPFWEQFCRHTSITCKLSYLLRCVEEWKHRPIHSWAWHLMGGKWRPSRPDNFTPQERASVTLWLGIWLCPDRIHPPTLQSQWHNPVLCRLGHTFTRLYHRVLNTAFCCHYAIRSLYYARIGRVHPTFKSNENW